MDDFKFNFLLRGQFESSNLDEFFLPLFKTCYEVFLVILFLPLLLKCSAEIILIIKLTLKNYCKVAMPTGRKNHISFNNTIQYKIQTKQ